MHRSAFALPVLLSLVVACGGGDAEKPPADTPSSFGKKAPRVAAPDAGAVATMDPATDTAMPKLKISSVTVVEKDAKGGSIPTLGPKEGLRSRISLKDGDVLDQEILRKDVAGIARLYHDAGYALVDVESANSVDMQKGEAAVEVTIKRGELAKIDAIAIEGNQATPEKTIRAQVKVNKGAAYSETKLDEAKARIEALGTFSKVSYRVDDKPSKTKVTVTFVVTEK